MKTWLKIFLPNDEYKERQMLIFLAEAAVLQVILILVFMAIDQLFIPLTSMFMLICCIFGILFYVGARYTLSGIEYTDICTEKEYKAQVKILKIKSVGFVVIYCIVAIVFEVFDWVSYFDTPSDRIDFLVVLALAGIFLFVTQYISLRKSYLKNKELM